MSFEVKHKLVNILITGCYRSGTTLIEKLIHSHPEVCISSQPFPVLYFYLKELFYERFRLERLYPLGPIFLEDSYSLTDFYSFLDQYKVTRKDIDIFFTDLKKYREGLWTPEILNYQSEVLPGSFLNIYKQLNSFIPEIFSKRDVTYTGGKEILCEEYVPYLLSKGVRVLIIIRDPRDVIVSLNFRKKDNLTGKKRPILYSLRLWRKSVAFALECEDNPNFMHLKYENLVQDPIEILNKIAAFLNIELFSPNIFKGGIRDQYGGLWSSNSSFVSCQGISRSSIGRFKDILPDYVISYIETCCLPEMRYLNYDLSQIENFDEKKLRNFKEPFPIKHEKFLSDKGYSLTHIEEEIERYIKLTGSLNLNTDEAEKWFLFEKVYKKYFNLLK
jgi:hypothetical protein